MKMMKTAAAAEHAKYLARKMHYSALADTSEATQTVQGSRSLVPVPIFIPSYRLEKTRGREGNCRRHVHPTGREKKGPAPQRVFFENVTKRSIDANGAVVVPENTSSSLGRRSCPATAVFCPGKPAVGAAGVV